MDNSGVDNRWQDGNEATYPFSTLPSNLSPGGQLTLGNRTSSKPFCFPSFSVFHSFLSVSLFYRVTILSWSLPTLGYLRIRLIKEKLSLYPEIPKRKPDCGNVYDLLWITNTSVRNSINMHTE